MTDQNKKGLTPEASDLTKTTAQIISEIEAELSNNTLTDLAKQIDRAFEMAEQGAKEFQDVVAEIEATKRKIDQLYATAMAQVNIIKQRFSLMNGGGK
jgi:peptidoglycan hydrolase CwlO-like protein